MLQCFGMRPFFVFFKKLGERETLSANESGQRPNLLSCPAYRISAGLSWVAQSMRLPQNVALYPAILLAPFLRYFAVVRGGGTLAEGELVSLFRDMVWGNS